MSELDLKISSPVLCCTLTVETLFPQGTVKKSACYKSSKISLGRNEFRDIILQMEAPKLRLDFIIKNFNLHKKFLREGKATLQLKDQLTNLMIANAPPNALLTFLKVLSGKTEKCVQNKENVPARARMLSNLPKSFDEISPMTVKDIESLRQRNGKIPLKDQILKRAVPGSSPVSSKRKLENGCIQARPTKMTKLLNPIVLNKDQRKVLIAIQSGRNVFFTGSAGTGKSFLLKRIVGMLPPDTTFVTASTGIDAFLFCCTTLHSFAGIGNGNLPINECINMARRKFVVQHWKTCKHLIIDEISMVDGEYFEKMEAVARSIRGNDKPFGGIQLVLCGDFLQLPPVSTKGAKKSFCFQSSAWDKCIDTNIELFEVKRQNDPLFIEILQNIRIGRCSPDHEKLLAETVNNVVEKEGIKATRLCTHKDDVEHINSVQLKKLPGDSKIYSSVDSDPHLSDTLDNSTPVLGKLHLKVGAQVMLMKNLDVSQGLVNGARGVVTGFSGVEGLPIVKFASGIGKELRHEKWSIKARGGLVVTRRQIPLKLAWAFSIHKSQGMTLDCVEMSLSKVFEAGQAYVALSRARNLKSLRILDFNTGCIKAHPDVQRFYYQLRKNCL